MKVMVIIPCYNEEKTLPLVIHSIPRAIPGVDSIEVLVVNDGSTDGTAAMARELGVDYLITLKRNRGLAAAFETGVNAALDTGADIIVTTDGDNQYPQADIPRLLEPILLGHADMVVGDRRTASVRHFSPVKKALQRLGTRVVQALAGITVLDAPSGFRAFTRRAAMQINCATKFSYVLETLIQAGKKGLKVAWVPIQVNAPTRESRLFRGTWQHVRRSGATIVRVYAMYEPLKVFTYIGGVLFLAGVALCARFLFLYLFGTQEGSGHVQSLILASILILIGFQVALIGLVADLIAMNRKLLEDILYRLKEERHSTFRRTPTAGEAESDRASVALAKQQ